MSFVVYEDVKMQKKKQYKQLPQSLLYKAIQIFRRHYLPSLIIQQ